MMQHLSPSRPTNGFDSSIHTGFLHPDETAVGTFHAFKGNKDGDKIDFVFVEPETRVLEAAILHDNESGRYPSDHFPVMAKILLTPHGK